MNFPFSLFGRYETHIKTLNMTILIQIFIAARCGATALTLHHQIDFC